MMPRLFIYLRLLVRDFAICFNAGVEQQEALLRRSRTTIFVMSGLLKQLLGGNAPENPAATPEDAGK